MQWCMGRGALSLLSAHPMWSILEWWIVYGDANQYCAQRQRRYLARSRHRVEKETWHKSEAVCKFCIFICNPYIHSEHGGGGEPTEINVDEFMSLKEQRVSPRLFLNPMQKFSSLYGGSDIEITGWAGRERGYKTRSGRLKTLASRCERVGFLFIVLNFKSERE